MKIKLISSVHIAAKQKQYWVVVVVVFFLFYSFFLCMWFRNPFVCQMETEARVILWLLHLKYIITTTTILITIASPRSSAPKRLYRNCYRFQFLSLQLCIVCDTISFVSFYTVWLGLKTPHIFHTSLQGAMCELPNRFGWIVRDFDVNSVFTLT